MGADGHLEQVGDNLLQTCSPRAGGRVPRPQWNRLAEAQS